MRNERASDRALVIVESTRAHQALWLLTESGFRPFDANHGVELNAIGCNTVLPVTAVEENYTRDTDSDRLAYEDKVTRGQRPDELEKPRSRRDGLLKYFGTLETAGAWELDDHRFPRRVPNHRVVVRICGECVANEEPSTVTTDSSRVERGFADCRLLENKTS